jgi:2-dehydro-3-deoxyphosphogluconate aldolase/(4S)-4-hydroxy-2-oxoglutarate aldolase
MTTESIYDRIGLLKVIPVVAIESSEHALPLADVLCEEGLPVVEITFRTEAAAQAIEKLHRERTELLVGAGTILTVDNLHRAVECGAAFGVAPGFNAAVVEEALKIGFPFAPGIMTPSDVEAALSLGIHVLKYFPAEAAGGLAFLNSIAAPYAHTGVRFIPTGGINGNNFKEYIENKFVLAVGGTWIARRDVIAAGKWNEIAENCRQIAALRQSVR